MRFEVTVAVEVERVQGKFASRSDLGEQIKSAIEDANPGSLEGENGGEYTVESWDVEEVSK